MHQNVSLNRGRKEGVDSMAEISTRLCPGDQAT